MFKKVLVIIYVIIFMALAYYVATIFIKRDINTSTEQDKKIRNTEVPSNNTNIPINNNETIDNENVIEEKNITEKNATYVITNNDCAQECKNIEDDNKLYYCKQICGLIPLQKNDKSCDDLSELSRDYCFRDQAVHNQDIKICNEIRDLGVKEQCKNRVSEDIIDEIM